MSFNRMKLFTIVAKRLNLTQAARQLHVSPSSVSHQMNIFQKEFGVKLYDRDGCGIRLTDAGEVLLRESESILARIEQLKTQFGIQRSEEARTLVVGGSYGPSAFLLPSLLAIFQKSHREVPITLRTDNRSVIEKLVLRSEVEIGLITNRCVSPGMVMEPFRVEHLVPFVLHSHPLARKPTIALVDLMDAPLIVRADPGALGKTRQLMRDLEQRGFRPKIVARCDSPDAVKTAVRNKMGVGFLYRDVVEGGVRSGDFKILKVPDLDVTGQSYIIYKKDRQLSTHAEEFLATLRQWRTSGANGSLSILSLGFRRRHSGPTRRNNRTA